MATSSAATVTEYLAQLPFERRKVVAAVRKVVLDHLPAGYEEAMNWGMISYQVPLTVHPRTYNGQPLMYAALAAQKNYFVLHLMGVYGSKKLLHDLAVAYKEMGKKMDMGKGCLRFKSERVAVCDSTRRSPRSSRKKK